VAADDSVMPQTIEAISHAKNAGVPMIVAINKCDLPAANPGKVKQELLQHNVNVEDFGGDVLAAEISAKTGQGIDDLLEKILLQSELLELRANPDRAARGTVIEAQLDVGKGPVVSVLVQKGTLKVGDSFVCGLYDGRVRALLDERGRAGEEAGPATPVQVLGASGVPQAGDTFQVMDADQAAEVIDLLPEELKAEVVIRIARLSDVQQSALAEIENLIASKAGGRQRGGSEKVGGDRVAASIINSLGGDKSEQILDRIKERNEELSDRIQEMMFVFDSLLQVDDRGIQALLREISNDVLVVALKGSDPAVRDKMLNNMSKRAAALLREDMEARGPIKVSEGEEAQKSILEIARRMADSGDIDLGGGGDEYV